MVDCSLTGRDPNFGEEDRCHWIGHPQTTNQWKGGGIQGSSSSDVCTSLRISCAQFKGGEGVAPMRCEVRQARRQEGGGGEQGVAVSETFLSIPITDHCSLSPPLPPPIEVVLPTKMLPATDQSRITLCHPSNYSFLPSSDLPGSLLAGHYPSFPPQTANEVVFGFRAEPQ